MAEPTITVDPALLAEFIDESLDMLDALDSRFIELEANPEDISVVEAIFRPVHSIKGNSGFFGFLKVKTLAHELENLLDQVRKEQLAVSAGLIDVLLRGMDALKEMFHHVREGNDEVDDVNAFEQLIETVKKAGAGEDSTQAWTSLFGRLETLATQMGLETQEFGDQLTEMIGELTKLSPLGESSQIVPEDVQIIRTILADPIDDQLADDKAAAIGHALSRLVEQTQAPGALAIMTELAETVETFSGSIGFDALLADIVTEKLDSFVYELPAPSQTDAPDETSSPASEDDSASKDESSSASTPKKAAPRKQPEAQKTMRVSESHIDTFLEYVGELLIVGDMYANVQLQMGKSKLAPDLVIDLKRTNETFATLSQNLQKSIMSIRKVSMSGLLQKVPRLVRDIASKAGKKIDVQITGDTTEVDKSLIDMFDAPLTHMVRNAADHGIEMPQAREEAGKNAEGTIHIDVAETNNHIVLTVRDNGAGLNIEKIQAKAQELGLTQAGDTLTQKQLVDFIFSSGVSTAEEVTDVSGRGVGMDVVKRMIDEAGGSITVETKSGEGSRFVIALPKSVTTQIMQAYLVRVGKHKYVLPMNKVHETVLLPRTEVKTVTGKGHCVSRHGEIYPVVYMSKALDIKSTTEDDPNMVMVSVAVKENVYAVVVDEVLGVQQVVLRMIDGLEIESELIVGGALMGDGSVALVVNVDGLVA